MKSFWSSFEESPKTVFCLQRSFRSALLAWLSGARDRIGFSSGAASFLYTQNVIRKWVNGYPEVEKNLDLLRAFFSDFESTWDMNHAKPLLQKKPVESKKNTGAVVVFSVGSPWPTKRWTTDNFVLVANKLCADGIEVVLAGDPASAPIANEIEKSVPSLLLKNRCGQTKIVEWVDLIGKSDLVLSGDSAAVHVASDLNVPTIALFGPTVPEFGYAPWRKHSKAIGVSHLDCRPCDIHGPKKCPKKHHKCMVDLSPDRVYREISRILVDRSPNEG